MRLVCLDTRYLVRVISLFALRGQDLDRCEFLLKYRSHLLTRWTRQHDTASPQPLPSELSGTDADPSPTNSAPPRFPKRIPLRMRAEHEFRMRTVSNLGGARVPDAIYSLMISGALLGHPLFFSLPRPPLLVGPMVMTSKCTIVL
jgi:hypothetical protein